jgi:hypothetical protein
MYFILTNHKKRVFHFSQSQKHAFHFNQPQKKKTHSIQTAFNGIKTTK